MPSDSIRWGTALGLVLTLHGAAAWLLRDRIATPMLPPPAPEAVMLDLAPTLPPIQQAALAPPPTASAPPPPLTPELPPPPLPEPQTAPETPPPELLPPTPPVPADAILPVPPPPPPPRPRPKPRPPERRLERPVPHQPAAREEPAPPSPLPAPVQAPPEPIARPPARAAEPPSNAIPNWRSELLGRLQRAKRYPDMARSRGDQGSAAVTFTMDRAGRVLAVSLARSSGSPLLDEEAVAMVRRAEPLPPIPSEIPGNTITFTVPVNFALR